MDQVYKWLIFIGIMGVQFFLSRRNNAYWGAILPVLYLVFIFGWLSNRMVNGNTFSLIIVAIGGLAILLGEWSNGRESLKKKRKKELEKMKTLDIK
ncbi:hypothetical protein QUF81_01140 [Peribacillus simplex]|uniref:Uncharacterized protein n=1 Tax=Peribacillus simplex TaxID=1478 RepID=A0AAW7I7R2_9BACI|nr:hypothetical protein [Peribacillus simplex]MDM5291894.1 hypothetical protein [Peribacillus simplex]MDM5451058.1 hypothetical protein [Peribacillus simplex]